MFKNISKKLILIILSVIITVVAVSGTFAYIFTKTPPVENTFEPVQVSCEVQETIDGFTKSNVKVKNTSDINAYVRATFVVMWTSEDGKVSSSPVLASDYTINFGSAKWVKGSDGFYYYTEKVASGAYTDNLLNTVSVLGEAPEGYTLSVHVAATAIQAEPASVITDMWGATVLDNGNITAP